MKELILVRGCPGSGKSTMARMFGGYHLETDQYFMVNGKYNFDGSKIKLAHEWCQNSCQTLMLQNEPRIVISNTFTQEWEMERYFELAKIHDYKIFTIVVENRHGGTNVHNVPDEILTKMKNRFEVKL